MTADAVEVRVLRPEDFEAYRELRTEMLLDTPHSFGPTPEEDACLRRDAFERRAAGPNQWIFGAFDSGGVLCGAAGLARQPFRKLAHRALVWGVYTRPSHRRRGVSAQLFSAIDEHAASEPGLEILELSVSAGAPGAQRVYERAGFVAWGTEPDKCRVAGVPYDEVYLQKRLRGPFE